MESCNLWVVDTNTFILKAKKLFGERHDYSKVCYKNSKTKVCIICPIHGEFFILPNNYLKSGKCTKCVILKKETCPICGKEFISKSPKTSLLKHLIWCESKKNFLEMYKLDKEKLTSEYEILGSVLIFMEKYPFWPTYNQYYKLFKEFDINVSVKQASRNEAVKLKRKLKNLELYGVEHNFCKDHPSRKKWEKRLFEEEGITNVFQRKDVIKRIRKTIVERYTVEEIQSNYIRGTKIISSLNKKLFDLLDNLDITFDIEFKILYNDGERYFSYDVLIRDSKKIIEVNGDYWHGNPKIYKKDDLILKNTHNEMKVADKWKYDALKINTAKENGYEVLVIWEYDFNNNLEETINKINNYAKY